MANTEPITPAALAAVEALLDPPISEDVEMLLAGLGVGSIRELHELVEFAREAKRSDELLEHGA